MAGHPLLAVDPSDHLSCPPHEPLEDWSRLRAIAEPSNPHVDWGRRREDTCPHVEQRRNENDEPETVASIYRWENVRECLRRSEVILADVYREQLEPVTGRGIHCLDPPEHTRLRGVLEPAFRDSIGELEDRDIRRLARGLVDSFGDRTRVDLFRDYTTVLPALVIGKVLGLPEEHMGWYRNAAYRFSIAYALHQMDSSHEEFLRETRTELSSYLRAIVQTYREASRGEGMLFRLLHDGSGDSRLSEEQIVPFLMHLAPASGTAGMALGTVLYCLLDHPEQHRLLREDASRIPGAVEEGLRWEPPFAMVERKAAESFTLDGTPIPAGARLMLFLAAANRDPRRFENPEEFDVLRESRGHLSFAAGPHVCLGESLARREMRAALRVLYEDVPEFRLDPDRGDETFVGGGYWRGVVQLPVLLNSE